MSDFAASLHAIAIKCLVIMDEPKEEIEVLVSKYTNIKPIHYY